jgi:hypothetical protein
MLPFQGVISVSGFEVSAVGTYSTSVLASLFISTFFTSERLTSSPTHLYQKDEPALPGDLRSRKLSSLFPF